MPKCPALPTERLRWNTNEVGRKGWAFGRGWGGITALGGRGGGAGRQTSRRTTFCSAGDTGSPTNLFPTLGAAVSISCSSANSAICFHACAEERMYVYNEGPKLDLVHNRTFFFFLREHGNRRNSPTLHLAIQNKMCKNQTTPVLAS